jgi:hypothetical protein
MPEAQAAPPLPKSQPSFGKRHSIIIKLLGVGALVLVLLVPLAMIAGRPLYIYRHHAQNTWDETHIMRSLTGRDNHVALNKEEQQWVLWSLTPVALRHLLLADGNCDVIPWRTYLCNRGSG